MPSRTRPPDNQLASFCWRYDTDTVERLAELAQTKLGDLAATLAGVVPFPRTNVPLGNFNGAGWRDWIASVEASNVDQITALQRLVATCRIRLGYELAPVSHNAPVVAPPISDGINDIPPDVSSNVAPPDISADIRLVKRHNSGLYGVVWSGVQISLDRNVAVKFIKPNMGDSAMVLDHARSLARVNHRNVVTIHQVTRVIVPETDQAADCIIMEWLEGEQLGNRLNGQKFPSAEALSVCLAIIDGVAAIHAEGIVHGDLHAGNVLLTQSGVKIIDIAYDDSHSLARLTTSSRDRHVVGDVEFVRYLVLRVLLHSDIPLPIVMPYEPRLRNAVTLDEVRIVMTEMEAALKQKPAAPIPAPPSVTRLPNTAVGSFELSGEAATLLVNGANDPGGRIMHLNFIGGEFIQTNGEQFIEQGNARSAAVWKAALEQLAGYGLIDETGGSLGAVVYRLTAEGYDVAEKIAHTM